MGLPWWETIPGKKQKGLIFTNIEIERDWQATSDKVIGFTNENEVCPEIIVGFPPPDTPIDRFRITRESIHFKKEALPREMIQLAGMFNNRVIKNWEADEARHFVA